MTALQRFPGEARLEAGIAPTCQQFACRMPTPESTLSGDALPRVPGLNRRGEL